MFYSYKDFPISIESFNISGQKNSFFSDYRFVAENINININSNPNFTFVLKNKKPYQGINTQGLTSNIQINFVGQIPYDNIFYNNIFLESGIKHNFKIKCGTTEFYSGYLQNFTSLVTPNNLVKHQAEFIFFSTGSGNLTGSAGSGIYPISNTTKDTFYPDASNTIIRFNDGLNELNNNEIRSAEINYRADIQPVYEIGNNYPKRVIFNKEEIDLNLDIDIYGLNIRNINNIITGTKIIFTGIYYNSTGISLLLNSGYLVNKTFNIKTNDIINSKINLKYFI